MLGVKFRFKILCDNQSAVKISCQLTSNKHAHHVEHEFYVTNQAIYKKNTLPKWIPGKYQLADLLTKALGKKAHSAADLIIQGYM